MNRPRRFLKAALPVSDGPFGGGSIPLPHGGDTFVFTVRKATGAYIKGLWRSTP